MSWGCSGSGLELGQEQETTLLSLGAMASSAPMATACAAGASWSTEYADDDLDGACWGGAGESAKMMMSLDTVEGLMDDCFGMPMAAAAATTLSAEKEEEDDDGAGAGGGAGAAGAGLRGESRAMGKKLKKTKGTANAARV